MLKIVGYADRYSVAPGEKIDFKISLEEGTHFDARLVRVIHGDCNPDGPGLKFRHVKSDADGRHKGRPQRRCGSLQRALLERGRQACGLVDTDRDGGGRAGRRQRGGRHPGGNTRDDEGQARSHDVLTRRDEMTCRCRRGLVHDRVRMRPGGNAEDCRRDDPVFA